MKNRNSKNREEGGSAKVAVLVVLALVLVGAGAVAYILSEKKIGLDNEKVQTDSEQEFLITAPKYGEIWNVEETREIQWNVPAELRDGSRVYTRIDIFPEFIMSEVEDSLETDDMRLIAIAGGDNEKNNSPYKQDFLSGRYEWEVPFSEFARKVSYLNIPLVVRVRMWKGDPFDRKPPFVSAISKPFFVTVPGFSKNDLKDWAVYTDKKSGTSFNYPKDYAIKEKNGKLIVLHPKFPDVLNAQLDSFVLLRDYRFENKIADSSDYYDASLGYWAHKGYNGIVTPVKPWGVTNDGNDIYRFAAGDAGSGHQEYVVWLKSRGGVAVLYEDISEWGPAPSGYTADDGYKFSTTLGFIARSIR